MSDPRIVAVMTTINPPTRSLQQLLEVSGWPCVVVGDRKTPNEWSWPGCEFLSVDEQLGRWPSAAALPVGHYSRKNVGYLEALRLGAEVVFDTDDDNAPIAAVPLPSFTPTEARVASGEWVNVNACFGAPGTWPRGFPLDEVTGSDSPKIAEGAPGPVGVWPSLVDGDADVDAIYRLTNAAPIEFAGGPLVLNATARCPYNSQATFSRAELAALCYLPTSVAFRYTDILRSVVAQEVMTVAGYRLGFFHGGMRQDRNDHNLMADFAEEISMHLTVKEARRVCERAVDSGSSVRDNLVRSYEALTSAGITAGDELEVLGAWLLDLENVNNS